MGGAVKKVFGGDDKAKKEAKRLREKMAREEAERKRLEAEKREKALESARLSAEQEASRQSAGATFLGQLQDDEDELGTGGKLGY